MSTAVDKRLRSQAGSPKLSLVPRPKTDLELIVEESERDFAEIRSLQQGVRLGSKLAIFLAFLDVLAVYALLARMYGII